MTEEQSEYMNEESKTRTGIDEYILCLYNYFTFNFNKQLLSRYVISEAGGKKDMLILYIKNIISMSFFKDSDESGRSNCGVKPALLACFLYFKDCLKLRVRHRTGVNAKRQTAYPRVVMMSIKPQGQIKHLGISLNDGTAAEQREADCFH